MELPSDSEKAREAQPTPILEPSEQISGHDTGEATAPRSEALSIQVVRRARWAENGQSSWILKACFKDGSAVLANVRFVLYIGYVWRAAGHGGYANTANGSKRAARRALREEMSHA